MQASISCILGPVMYHLKWGQTGLHLNQTKQISAIIFSNALVAMLLIKLGDLYVRALSELQKNQTNYSFSLHVIFRRKMQHCMC